MTVPDAQTPSTAPVVDGVVWDFGNVLIRWDPLPAIAAGVGDADARTFMATYDFGSWNYAQDAGRTWDEALAVLERSHPHFLPHGRGYRTHFAHSLVGEIPGTAQILRDLHAAGVPLLGLTNWSEETFGDYAPPRFDFLALFDDIVVSGTERLAKPDPAIYRLAIDRSGLPAERLVFIDDRSENVAAAEAAGMRGIVFTDAAALRSALVDLGLLTGSAP